jgi:hypothetical protein
MDVRHQQHPIARNCDHWKPIRATNLIQLARRMIPHTVRHT